MPGFLSDNLCNVAKGPLWMFWMLTFETLARLRRCGGWWWVGHGQQLMLPLSRRRVVEVIRRCRQVIGLFGVLPMSQ